MSADKTLDIESLLLPIPDASSPGGVPMTESLRGELERLRKPAATVADGALTGLRIRADFAAIREQTIAALTTSSKDIGLLVRLVEANTHVHELPGLRDGLELAHRMIAECWDWLHPIPKHEEDASRGNRLKWLNAADAGAEFPQTIQLLPILNCGSDQFTYFDTLNPDRLAELEANLVQCKPAAILAVQKELAETEDSLTALARELKTRLGVENAPDLTGNNPLNLGTAIRNCRNWIDSLVTRLGLSSESDQADSPTDSSDNVTVSGRSTSASGVETRDLLYQQIERIAAQLKRAEPHSPVPFLLERCVALGKLPFPELMSSLIREAGALSELDRLLGRQSS